MWPQLKPQQAWRLLYYHFIVVLKTFKQWDYLASAVKRVSLNKVRIIATTILPIFCVLVLVFYELKDLSLWAWELWIYKTHGMILLHVSALASKPLCTHKILLSARQWIMIAARFSWKKVLKILASDWTLLKMIHFRHLSIHGVVFNHACFIFHSSPFKFLSSSGIPMLMFWLSFWVLTGSVQMIPCNRSLLGVW